MLKTVALKQRRTYGRLVVDGHEVVAVVGRDEGWLGSVHVLSVDQALRLLRLLWLLMLVLKVAGGVDVGRTGRPVFEFLGLLEGHGRRDDLRNLRDERGRVVVGQRRGNHRQGRVGGRLARDELGYGHEGQSQIEGKHVDEFSRGRKRVQLPRGVGRLIPGLGRADSESSGRFSTTSNRRPKRASAWQSRELSFEQD